MTLGPQIEPGIAPFRLARVRKFRREEIPLWNWYSAAFPGAGDWRTWLRDIAAQLLRRPGRARARLIKTSLVDAAAPPERFSFEGEWLGIGRDPGNEIVLPEATITRQHARLRADGQTFFLEDLGSAMGTIGGGTKLTPGVDLELADGDGFVIFPYRFQLEVERAWLPAGDVVISETSDATETWEAFRRDCPAGWSMLTLHVEPLAQHACMAVEAALLQDLVERALPSRGQWGAVDEAVTEVLLLALLERANRDLALPFRFSLGSTRRRPDLPDAGRGIALRATLAVEGIRGAIRLFLSFDLLSAMRADWPGRAGSTLAQQASLPFAVAAGTLDLSAAEQASIEPGDIILYSADAALLAHGDDRLGWECAWDTPQRLRIVARKPTTMLHKSDDPLPIHDVPLRFQVVVDEHEMTLAEAEKLTPGAVLDLDRDPREPVRLAVNGRTVGTGELVEIEGRMGVRILSWSRA